MRKLIAVLVFALPVAAMAQTQKARPAPAPKRITIDDPDEIEGHNAVGQGDIITAKRRIVLPSMIKVRQDFWPEMLKRASDI